MNNGELTRAKEYALRSLTCQEQTEFQIRQKLQKKGYTGEIADAVLTFLKEYNYINDTRFLEQYVACHCNRMNRKQLLERLSVKGFRNPEIDGYLELYQYDEEKLLQQAVRKYIKGKDLSDCKVRQKVFLHFRQKGYSGSMIRNVVYFAMEDNFS